MARRCSQTSSRITETVSSRVLPAAIRPCEGRILLGRPQEDSALLAIVYGLHVIPLREALQENESAATEGDHQHAVSDEMTRHSRLEESCTPTAHLSDRSAD